MSRSPAYLAALASTSVPGLDPVTVQAVRPWEGTRFDVAFVVDGQQRRWTVRVPRTGADGARQDATVALLGLLGRRVPFSIPSPKGFTGIPEGRAMVYPHLAGRSLDLAHLPAGPGLAAEVGRAVAALHNVDRQVFDEAGAPAYDAETYRSRHLAALDRAAATGHVPAGLLQRWESALEDVTLWRFAPVPVHGRIDGRALLVVFDSEDDATTGHVRAVTGWEHAKVADPADDLAAIVGEAPPAAAESVLEAYANSRIERPDTHLRRRAVLVSELRLLGDLLTAATGGEGALVREFAGMLRDLDERTRGDDSLAPPPPGDPAAGFVPSGSDGTATSSDHGFGEVVAFGAPGAGLPGPDAESPEHSTQEIPEHQLAKARGTLGEPADVPGDGSPDQPDQPEQPDPFDEFLGELDELRDAEHAPHAEQVEQVEDSGGRERA